MKSSRSRLDIPVEFNMDEKGDAPEQRERASVQHVSTPPADPYIGQIKKHNISDPLEIGS
jgi:hypothetical protein